MRRIAEGIDIVLANLVEQWEIDLEGRLRSLMTNSEKITKGHHELLEEAIKKIDYQRKHYEHLIQSFDSLKENIKNQHIFELWNQKIQKYTEGAISTPLQYWNVFKQKPTKATRTKFPFIYVIIVYAPHIQRLPEVFYVGQSSQQPYERFSNHNGLKSVEALMKYGYTYEIRYFESKRFQINAVINTTETALRAALSPYWEHLTAEQRDKIKRGELISDGLFGCLFTKDELTIAI
ncbi:MAG: hypothetical protein KME18_02405 [Phormidium tanganyikae FI6-MK23]|nr:hypothetical protein [Phormidium tanganyikae FI6-MK23]